MAYIPLDDIKKNIVGYLEESINSQIFDYKNLSLIYINKNITYDNTDIKKIKKAIDGLIDDGEIQKYKSNLEIYVPTAYKTNENLKPLKLGDPFRTIMNRYIFGFFAIVLFMQISYFWDFILSMDFSKPVNIIFNSFLLGGLLPYGVGYILNVVSDVIRKPLSNVGVNKVALYNNYFMSLHISVYLYGLSFLFSETI